MNEILAWGTRVTVVALAATLLAATTQSLAQEGAELLPPQVIAVQPYPGEEVLADQPVTLVFDQAMDAASVEAAWQMEPTAPLEFTWADARTLRAILAGGWQRATRYAVTLGTGARSADGVALAEPHKFFVQTI
ncbi:MAG: Ig-like domain-containing protein, partial [Chloroflexota bacterium]